MKERRILVVGGAGYIGTILTQHLLNLGNQVTALDNLLYRHGFAVHGFLNDPNYTFIFGDIRNPRQVSEALQGVTDVVLLAALVGDPVCKKYPDLARATNLEASVRLFDQLTGSGINRFIFASTCSNYGLRDTEELASEDAPLNPVSLYAETKVAMEHHILENLDRIDFSATILRFATAYGFSRRMRFDLTVSEFVRALTLGDDLLVYDENTWRPYCHVLDISRAVHEVLEADEEDVRGEIFNVGSPDENYTKKMIVDMALSHGVPGRPSYREGGVDPRNYRVSTEKFRNRFDFKNDFVEANKVRYVLLLE